MKSDMGGLRKVMPQTYRTFIIGSIALAGLPPFAGFWSKDEILVGTGGWGIMGGTNGNGSYTFMLVMGMITAALTAAYMTRCVYLTFFGEFRGHGNPHESGPRITIPLWILAVLAVFAGFLNLPKGFQLVPESLCRTCSRVFPQNFTCYPKLVTSNNFNNYCSSRYFTRMELLLCESRKSFKRERSKPNRITRWAYYTFDYS